MVLTQFRIKLEADLKNLLPRWTGWWSLLPPSKYRDLYNGIYYDWWNQIESLIKEKTHSQTLISNFWNRVFAPLNTIVTCDVNSLIEQKWIFILNGITNKDVVIAGGWFPLDLLEKV